MRLGLLIGMLIGWLAFACPASRGAVDAGAREIARRAGELIREGERTWGDDREVAEANIRQGIELLESLDDARVGRGVARERTIGGGRLLLGEQGPAVLHLRRALALDPTDREAREMLGAARSRVGAAPAPAVEERARRALLWWRGFVPRQALLGVCVAAWLVAWGLLMSRRFGAPTIVRPIGVGLLLVSLLSGGALASEHVLAISREDGVVVLDNVIAHNGPSSDVYPPTFTEPLEAGIEVLVLERRDGWARVRLASGQETWVPGPAIELIRPMAVTPLRGG